MLFNSPEFQPFLPITNDNKKPRLSGAFSFIVN